MKRLVSLLGAVLIVSTVAFTPVAGAMFIGNNKPLSVCVGDDGKQKVGELDVVLLMDNSKSLDSKTTDPKTGKRKATDPKGLRFKAVRDLLVALGEVKNGADNQQGVKINFGMISFSSRAQIEIPMQLLEDPNSLADEVQETLPPTGGGTDYIEALERAIELLKDRPESNCKFLVWFTDGQFDAGGVALKEPKRSIDIGKQARGLEGAVCGADGLANQFHTLRINTFVLVLRPTDVDARLDASYGAMQAITGAYGEGKVPDEVAKGKKGDLCGNISERDHLGDILVAEDASSIARKVPTIANGIDSWDPVTACPVSSDNKDMPKMPAARHLSKLSFTAYEKGTELSSLDGAKIITVSGEAHPFSDYLETVTESEFEKKYSFTKSATRQLEQGWTFSIASGEVGWCVQMLPRKFEVAIYTENSVAKVREIAASGQPADEESRFLTVDDLDRLIYRTAKGVDLPTLEAASSETEGVVAFLDIDPTDTVFPELLPVTVRQDKVPFVQCSTAAREIAIVAAEPMPSSRKKSVSCDIDTTNTPLGDVTISIFGVNSLEDEVCASRLGLVYTKAGEMRPSDAKPVQTVQHPKGHATFHVVLTASNRSATCKATEGSFVLLDYGTAQSPASTKVPVIVDVDWRKVPVWWVVLLITIAILVLVILFNLLIMRVLVRKSSLMPKFGVDAYEIPVLVAKDSNGRVSLLQRDGTPASTHVFDLAGKIVLDVAQDRRSAALRGGSRSKLRVKLPPLYSPFRQAVLVVESSQSAYYWQAIAGGRGLSPAARSGGIIHSPRRVGEDVEAMATFLLPSGGSDRQQFIRETLGGRLASVIQSLATDPDWFSNASPIQPQSSAVRQHSMPSDEREGSQPGADDPNRPRIQPPPPPPPPPPPQR